MLGSTLLSAATALFFLPSVFSAPVAPVIAINSVSVPEVQTTTISTTRSVAIQKVATVLTQKKEALQAYKATADSKVDLEWAQGICGHVSGILTDTVTAVQSASTSPVDVIAVDVDISPLIKCICEIVALVCCILGHVCMIVNIALTELVPIIASVLAALLKVLHVVESLVSGILLIVGGVLIKVTGIVDIIKVLVAWDVRGIQTLVTYLAVPM
ncbi:hypothetical protein FRC00_003759 [Tulasnella sp. 408]|nr:hypothetical protein FRC00_003759 [Tulasnella sp. 408]